METIEDLARLISEPSDMEPNSLHYLPQHDKDLAFIPFRSTSRSVRFYQVQLGPQDGTRISVTILSTVEKPLK